ncbi:MAG: transposase [Clostridia bacterium]|nr:transposase [Clostridia bacterium]
MSSRILHRDGKIILPRTKIHARRKYADFIKSVGVEKAKGTIAAEGYSMITNILHTDNGYDDLSNTDRKKMRQRELKAMVDDYFSWAKLKYTQVTRGSVIGKALAYSINQEEYLRTFLNDGKVPSDNNYAEQAIRPFTIARKNFVLMESSKGASASAMIFSIAETAKANQLNTYEYFELLLTELSKHQDDRDMRFLDDLLPWSKNVQEKCPSRLKKS